ncbi:MAG: GNAT family N-acetyltransferase [Xanthomonadales bacterium]|jgi:CRP-like cAMP-binding protein/GNAT superfamily N-acetyltransferase|nr:GNAT family N-acetyltransferase [Xanthomonadales bacterium]
MEARKQTTIREARESDVPGILELFATTYGRDYPYAGFMDEAWLKRAVFNDNLLMLVAEAQPDGDILGTASVVFDIGTHSDLLGELGRLVVSAEARGLGIGTQLMAGRLERIRERLHVAIVENRTPHPFSQRISLDFDFAPVGFLPLKRRFDARESIALFARHFDGALELRRNNPRILPEAQDLAHQVFTHCQLPLDIILDEEAPPYPQDAGFRIDEFTPAGLPALLRIERGRLAGREVFGPVRLQYGAFALSARHADYLLARPQGLGDGDAPIAGAIGYIHDEVERSVRIFELIASNDRAIRFLLESLLERCQSALQAEYIEIDVSAYAPRMQRTLLELGFLPIAYVPAMVFHRVERLDVLKMARLLVPPEFGDMSLTPGAQVLADLVGASFREQAVLPEVAEALHRLDLLHGLSAEQTRRVAAACRVAHFESGEALFEEGTEASEVHVILEGMVEVRPGADGPPLGQVRPGESLGEIALLTRQPHSARALAVDPVRTATLNRHGFESLARQRPDIATILLRNLAVGLGTKLQRLGATVTTDEAPDHRGLVW